MTIPQRETSPEKLRVLDLFSGIGGFSLGLERTGGFETAAFCEIEEFPRRVLAKHWPEVPCYHDVTKLTADILDRDGIGQIDVITGGFPCQDLSTAGKQAGLGEGTRSGLWSEIVRLIGEIRPRYVIVENVANLLSGPSSKRGGWFGRVLGDLAECGYDAEWENIPAAALGAPHQRNRVWLVAYSKENGRPRGKCRHKGRKSIGNIRSGLFSEPARNGSRRDTKPLANPPEVRQQGSRQPIFGFCTTTQKDRETVGAFASRLGDIWRSEPNVGRVANGVPKRVDRLGGLGNAVVPQIPEMIGNAILQAEASVCP